MKEVRDLEEIRSNVEDAAFRNLGIVDGTKKVMNEALEEKMALGEVRPDHTHGEGHIPAHSHGEDQHLDYKLADAKLESLAEENPATGVEDTHSHDHDHDHHHNQEPHYDHVHGEGHVPPHSHGEGHGASHEHDHNHDHTHTHGHGDSCGCGHDHGPSHEHNHEHAHIHVHGDGESCGCGHDHDHTHDHAHDHHVPSHPEDCQCEICHPHEEYCDVCGESLANCKCVMPDAGNIKKVYIMKNLDCKVCAARMEYKIKALPGVSYASVSAVSQQLRLSAKDPDRVLPLIQEIVQSIDSAVRVIPRDPKPGMVGKYRIYDIKGLDCAACATKVEEAISAMPEVGEAILVYATGQLRVAAENYEGLTERMQAVTDKVEDGVIISERQTSGSKPRVYEIKGLDCAACANKVEDAINDLPEIDEAVLTYATGLLRVTARSYEGLTEKMQAVADKVEDGVTITERFDRPAALARQENKEKSSFLGLSDTQRELTELTIGGVIFIVAEWMGLVPEEYKPYALVLAYVILGWKIVLTAVRNIARGEFFDENFLMTVATLGAFAIQAWEEAVGVIFFYRVGEWFQDRAADRSRDQIMEAVDMRPEVVNLLIGDEVKVIPSEEARVGDILLVRAGDRIPLDGVVIEGESLLDTSPVTGEPVPVRKKYGDEVLSGCVNTSGMLKIRVEKELQESMVTKILDSVENAAANKPYIDKFITRFARVYTPFVVAAAIAVAVIPSLVTGNWHYWIYTALTFLVISCPCALVLSVPLSFFAGIGAGSKLGILFKGGSAMELLKNVAAIVMDKTGTVTKGNFVLQKIQKANDTDDNEILRLTAGAEQVSSHPIAASIVAAAKEKGMQLQRPDRFEEVAGEGLVAFYGSEMLLAGNTRLMERYGVDYSKYQAASYGSEVLVAKNGVFLGNMLINDTLKEDAKQAVEDLKKQGLVTVMLTGDARKEAEAVAAEAGIEEVRAELLPQDKLKEMNLLRNKFGGVMFVGDGINDAPVLAGADVGAAMGSGADAAIEAADVVFMNSEMASIPKAVAIAKDVNRVAWQNVVFALVVKVIIMAAGIFGFASMWAAVFADTGVSVLCVLNACRILYKKY